MIWKSALSGLIEFESVPLNPLLSTDTTNLNFSDNFLKLETSEWTKGQLHQQKKNCHFAKALCVTYNLKGGQVGSYGYIHETEL